MVMYMSRIFYLLEKTLFHVNDCVWKLEDYRCQGENLLFCVELMDLEKVV